MQSLIDRRKAAEKTPGVSLSTLVYISRRHGSRAEANQFIIDGAVRVNGKLHTDPYKVIPTDREILLEVKDVSTLLPARPSQSPFRK